MTPVSTRTVLRSVRFLVSFALLLCLLAARPIVARAGGITGRVVDPDGRPVSGATVLVDGPLGTRTVRADDKGQFAIALDDRTTYRLLVQAPGFIADPVTVRGSETVEPADDRAAHRADQRRRRRARRRRCRVRCLRRRRPRR